MSLNSNQVVCGLCLKPFSDPRLLPCLHTFCLKCLKGQVTTSESAEGIRCHACQRCINVSAKGADSLPQDQHAAFQTKVADILGSLEGASGLVVGCDGCAGPSSSPAALAKAYCCQCSELLCQLCWDHHMHHHRLQHHTLVCLERGSVRALEACMKPHRLYCSQPAHAGEAVDFFCEDCNDLVCHYCLVEGHRGHKCVLASHLAQTYQNEMRESLEPARSMLEKITKAIGDIEAAMKEVEAARQSALCTLNATFEELQNSLKERQEILTSKIDDIALVKSTSLNFQKEQFLVMKRELASCADVVTSILKNHTGEQIICLKRFPQNRLSQILSEMKDQSPAEPAEQGTMAVCVDGGSLKKTISQFGIVDEVIPANCTWKQESDPVLNTRYEIILHTRTKEKVVVGCEGLKVKAELISKGSSEATLGHVDDQGGGTYTITFTPQTTGHCQLCISVDGRHVSRSPCDVHVRGVLSFPFAYTSGLMRLQ